MELEETIKEFGSGYNLCKKLGITPQNITHWKKIGYIPELQQRRIEDLTGGKLLATQRKV